MSVSSTLCRIQSGGVIGGRYFLSSGAAIRKHSVPRFYHDKVNKHSTNSPKSYLSVSQVLLVTPRSAAGFVNWHGFAVLPFRKMHTGSSKDERDRNDGPPKSSMMLPPLMDFPRLMWPKVMNTIRNWFFSYFVIKPYFDNEFSIKDFMQGAHEAISLVSTKLSTGQLDDLEGLVDPSAMLEIKNSLSTFSVFQQDLLRVAVEDIYFSFPYQIGVIIPDGPTISETRRYLEQGQKPPPQIRHVEITVVLHVLRGMEDFKNKTKESGEGHFQIIDLTKNDENKHRVMVCNYRFFRDFTEGCKDPTWIINMVNHFLPADLNNRFHS